MCIRPDCEYPHIAIALECEAPDAGLIISACALDIAHELGHYDEAFMQHAGAIILGHAYHYLYECQPGQRHMIGHA